MMQACRSQIIRPELSKQALVIGRKSGSHLGPLISFLGWHGLSLFSRKLKRGIVRLLYDISASPKHRDDAESMVS